MTTFSRLFHSTRLTLTLPRGAASVTLFPLTRTYYVKPKEKKNSSGQAWLLLAGVTLAVGGFALYTLGRPEDDIIGLQMGADKYADENIIKAYYLRARDKVTEFRQNYTEPSSDKLLPNPLPHPYQRRYTLLIELKDLLIHSNYDRKMGWMHQKRPGLDSFLNRLFDYYEIVVFTSENALSAHPLIDKMDPNQFILYRLYRDSTKYINGEHVKDLTNLNRSLNRVIVLDTNSSSLKFQPENGVILKKWTGDIYDTTLSDITSFLLTIALSGTDDVRPTLNYYKTQGEERILETFKENQAKLIEAEGKKQSFTSNNNKIGGTFNVFSLRSLQHQDVPPVDATITDIQPSTDNPSNVSETKEVDSNTDDNSLSVINWLGSWIGWK